MPLTEAAAMAISGGAQAGLGVAQLIGQRRRERRAMDNQIRLMDIQQKNQMALNRQGQQIQQETWEHTNYPRQIQMLKEAGMNPALLYSKGGSGGVTGSQSGGSAASGNAPAIQPFPTMDISHIAKVASEIEVNKSIAKLNNSQADKTSGVDTNLANAQIDNIIQNISNEKIKGELLEINKQREQISLNVDSATYKTRIDEIQKSFEKLSAETKSAEYDAKVKQGTYYNEILKVKNETYKSVLENALINEQIAKTKIEADAIVKNLAIAWKQLGLNDRGMTAQEKDVKIKKFKAEMDANQPGIDKFLSGLLWGTTDAIAVLNHYLFFEGLGIDYYEYNSTPTPKVDK